MLPEIIKEVAQKFASLPTLCQVAIVGSLILCALLFWLVSWLDKKYPVPPDKEKAKTLIIICQLSQAQPKPPILFVLPPPETDFPDKIIDPNKN